MNCSCHSPNVRLGFGVSPPWGKLDQSNPFQNDWKMLFSVSSSIYSDFVRDVEVERRAPRLKRASFSPRLGAGGRIGQLGLENQDLH